MRYDYTSILLKIKELKNEIVKTQEYNAACIMRDLEKHFEWKKDQPDPPPTEWEIKMEKLKEKFLSEKDNKR